MHENGIEEALHAYLHSNVNLKVNDTPGDVNSTKTYSKSSFNKYQKKKEVPAKKRIKC
jgi:hypothetical protein